MNDLSRNHERLRVELTSLLRDRGPAEVAGLPVPACPGWTVHDTVAHLAGGAADVLAGNMDGVATPAWTDAQVQARRDVPLATVLDEWNELAPQVEAVSEAFGSLQAQWLFDATSHDTDIRGALGAPASALDPGPEREVLRFVVKGFVKDGLRRGVPVPVVMVDGDVVVERDGVGPARVSAPGGELLRGLSGRRSLGQIRQWSWSDDPEPYLGAFDWAIFAVPASDLTV